MNSAPPGPTDDDHCYDTTLNLSAANLDVYKHERLAYTEIPTNKSAAERRATRKAALLKAMYHWVFSR
jgi:hypothetical protein